MNSYKQHQELLNVTDLTSYLYCPRKFYLEKVKGLKQPPSKPMIEGKIRHKILEVFSKNEQELVEEFGILTQQQIIGKFSLFLEEIIKQVFEKNKNFMKKFSISDEELKEKILKSMFKDVELRAEAIEKTIQKGFLKQDLWKNLTPKYISEFFLMSDKLGLKGKADRVMFNSREIIPFELKTRPTEKVWPSDKIQLTAYAMLLEDLYEKNIPLGIIESGNKKHEIPITSEMRQNVLNLIREVKNIGNNPNIRFPSNFAKCRSCFWEKECDEL